jgi:DNA-binding transcriptional LysR family regulator
MRDISIKQLRAFLAVAAVRNFAQAAGRLHISASALSVSVQELESRVNVKLFERSTRSVTLTAAGAAFLPVVERLLSDFRRALEDLTTNQGMQRDRVLVSAGSSVITAILGAAIGDFRNINNNVDVRLVEDHTQTVTAKVARNEFDFGITTLWTKMPSLVTVPFLDDRLGVLVTPTHPLGRSDSPLTWKDLSGHTIVALPPGSGLRIQIELNPKISEALGRPSIEVSSAASLTALVETGTAYAVVPALLTRTLPDKTFVFRPLVRPVVWRSLFLVRTPGTQLSGAALGLLRCTNVRLKALEGSHIRPNQSFDKDAGLVLQPSAG